MIDKDKVCDHEYLEEMQKVASICELYQSTVDLLNHYFVFDKVHDEDVFTENERQYQMFKLEHQPKGLIDTRELLQSLPDFQTSDIVAATMSLEQHLQIYRVVLQSLIRSKILLVDLGDHDDDQVKEVKQSVDQLLTQYQNVDDQLLIDCQDLQKKAPEKIIFAYAMADLNQINGLDQQMIDNMKQLIIENHQTIENAQAAIDKADRVNDVLNEAKQAITEAKKEG